MKLKIVITILTFQTLISCNNSKTKENNSTNKKSKSEFVSTDGKNANRDLLQSANLTINILNSENLEKLKEVTDSTIGVLFYPYGNIDKTKAQNLTITELSALFKNNSQIIWGIEDGTGEPIKLNAKQYFEKYVNDRNYSKADTIKTNDIVQIGNLTNNIKDVFPNADFIEYFVTHKTNNELDWKALRLVFKKLGQNYILVGIIHNQWTS